MNSVHHHPDRRSPYVFDVQELGRRPGALKEVKVAVPAPPDLGYDMIAVPQGSEVDLDLKFEAVVEGVLVTGSVLAEVRGECARCLDAIEGEQAFDVQELYFYPGNEVDEDESLVVDEVIDLEEALRDAVVLELPFTPLCEPDCLGLCQECGVNLNRNPDHGHAERVDPRWEKLVGLEFGDNN
ncbi:MAG: YceD family protein [Propionibacteriaceae bacterium]|nr:YceD family protein [Propionibacteriaceae bacterium]